MRHRHHDIFEISDELPLRDDVATTVDEPQADPLDHDDPRSSRVDADPVRGLGEGVGAAAGRRRLIVTGGAVVVGVAGITSTLLLDRATEPTTGATTRIQAPARAKPSPRVARASPPKQVQRPAQGGEPHDLASNTLAPVRSDQVSRDGRSSGLGTVSTPRAPGQAKSNELGHEFSFER